MTRVLVIGHSFVARYRRYLCAVNNITTAGRGFDFSSNLGLPRETVYISGRGGLKLDRPGEQFIRDEVLRFRPSLIILELGSNDLSISSRTESDVHGRQIARQICDFSSDLIQHHGVKVVVVCQVIRRRRFRGSTLEDFTAKIQAFNNYLQSRSRSDRRIYTFKHDRAAIVRLAQEHSNDDIHITTSEGFRLYNFSIRRAILKGLEQMRKLELQ